MVMNVLEEYSGSVFTGNQKVEAVCPDRNLSMHHSDYTVQELGRV
jgi:nitrate/TMAO reductase-like tetraheme cytochrome c subunit